MLLGCNQLPAERLFRPTAVKPLPFSCDCHNQYPDYAPTPVRLTDQLVWPLCRGCSPVPASFIEICDSPSNFDAHGPPKACSSAAQRDAQCPVCLQTPTFPVRTNCGHLFCAPCLITYWRHGTWLDAISCPLCRQKVSVLCHLFSESRSDQQSNVVLEQITDYNRRYSGAPRTVSEYLHDAPLLLHLMARGLGTMGWLLWLFFIRVALCCVGMVVSISSHPSESMKSSAGSGQSDPSLCGLLGVLDDLVVVVLLLLCVINVNQQMAPQRGQAANVATTRTVIGNSF